MTVIAAKPTLYRGTRFRSRLEARWAVFFDALAIDWTYEPIVDGAPAGYLPDFKLTAESFFEVKPDGWLPASVSGVGAVEWGSRHHKDFKRWGEFAKAVPPHVLIVAFGEPATWENGRLTDYANLYAFEPSKATPASFAECPTCRTVGIVPEGERLDCGCPFVFGRLRAAYHTVRDASYEDAP